MVGGSEMPETNTFARRAITVIVSAVLVVFSLAFYHTEGFGFLSVHPRQSFAEYQWGELKLIANMIASADSDEEGLEIAKQFNLCRDDGTLDPESTKVMKFADRSGKQSFRIVGFRQDKVAGRDALYGITFCFVSSVGTGSVYDADWSVKDGSGWEASTLRSTVNDYVGTPPSYHDKFPVELGRAIKAVEKSSNAENGGFEGEVNSEVDKVFVLSYEELFGMPDPSSTDVSSLDVANAQDTQYQFFAEYFGKGGDKAFEVDAYPFWLRTSADGDNMGYLAAVADGEVGQFVASENLNVIVGFCL